MQLFFFPLSFIFAISFFPKKIRLKLIENNKNYSLVSDVSYRPYKGTIFLYMYKMIQMIQMKQLLLSLDVNCESIFDHLFKFLKFKAKFEMKLNSFCRSIDVVSSFRCLFFIWLTVIKLKLCFKIFHKSYVSRVPHLHRPWHCFNSSFVTFSVNTNDKWQNITTNIVSFVAVGVSYFSYFVHLVKKSFNFEIIFYYYSKKKWTKCVYVYEI